MDILLVALGDTHGGHKLGLMNPDVVLLDEDSTGKPVPWTPRPTATQKQLWKDYMAGVRQAVNLASGAPIIVIHNGDLTRGKKYPQHLVSSRDADQILIAAANLAPWCVLPNLKAMYIVQGTGAHNFLEGTSEVLVADLLQRTYPDKSISYLSHGLLDIEGCLIDYAHHGPPAGIRRWTKGNQLRLYAKSIVDSHLVEGHVPPPRLIIRSHYHELVWETIHTLTKYPFTTYTTDILILPPYCGLSDHGRQVAKSIYEVCHGMVVFRISGGKLVDIMPIVHYNDLRRRETICV